MLSLHLLLALLVLCCALAALVRALTHRPPLVFPSLAMLTCWASFLLAPGTALAQPLTIPIVSGTAAPIGGIEIPPILAPFVPYLLYFAALAVGGVVAWACTKGSLLLLGWLETHVQNAKLLAVLKTIVTTGSAAVLSVDQSFVEVIKGSAPDGKLSPEQAKVAQEKAIELIKATAGAKAVETLKKLTGTDDVSKPLGMVVDALVRMKNATEEAHNQGKPPPSIDSGALAAMLTGYAAGKA